MIIKNNIIIEVEVKGRKFSMECSPESPLPDVMEANSIIGSYLTERIKASEQKPEEPKPSE